MRVLAGDLDNTAAGHDLHCVWEVAHDAEQKCLVARWVNPLADKVGSQGSGDAIDGGQARPMASCQFAIRLEVAVESPVNDTEWT